MYCDLIILSYPVILVFKTGSFQDVCHIKHWPLCIQGFRGGKLFPRTPISPCAGLSFPVGCAPATAAALRALLVRRRRPTLHRPPAAGYGRGPSLRCVRLRRFCSLPPASALPNRAVLSHPLRGACRAFVPGSGVRGRSANGNHSSSPVRLILLLNNTISS